MAGGREPAHIGADLGEEHAGDGVADAGHRDQVGDGGAKGSEGIAHARLHVAHRGFERVDLRQVELEQEAMVGCDTAVQGVDQGSTGL